jgi:LacI family transcriptional regulator
MLRETIAQSFRLTEMVTTRDVARRAGVSVSTVSHVLNATRFVAPERRERVLLALNELGYEPNAVARSLRINRSRSIGLIISDISNPFFTAVVRGIEDVAQQNDYTLVLCNSDEDPEKEETYLRTLRAKRVDGLILAPAGTAHAYLETLVRERFPLVFLDREVAGLEVPVVVVDNEQSAYAAVRHLVEDGHRRIGLVAGRSLVSTSRERLDGYRRALAEASIAFADDLVEDGGSKIQPGEAAALRLLDLEPRPTAIFSANNQMTIGCLVAIEARGLRVPRDVALVSFDDFTWSEVFRPRLTTVAQPTYELGRAAAHLLLRRLESEPPNSAGRVVLNGSLVVRESCSSGRHGARIRQLRAGRGSTL